MAVNDVIHRLVPQEGRLATVLAVGLPEIGDEISQAEVTHSPSGQAALEMLHVLQVDLILTPSRLLDLTLKEFSRRLHNRWPRQRWAVIKQKELTLLEEREIRQLSVLGIFEPLAPQRCEGRALPPHRDTLNVRSVPKRENAFA